MLDIATLSISDRNKPLLVDFVPLINRALKERGDDNPKLVKLSVQALAQLFFEPKCRTHFQNLKADLIKSLKTLAINQKEDIETAKSAEVLVHSIEELDKKPAPEPRKSSITSKLFARKSSTASAPPQGHGKSFVFLS